jgi:hypothetical protein
VEDNREHFIQGEGFEDTKEMKDEDIGGTRGEGSKDENIGRTEDRTGKVTGFDKYDEDEKRLNS